MYNIEDAWDPNKTVLLVNHEKELSKYLSLTDIINRALIEENLDTNTVKLSYDRKFLDFEQIGATTKLLPVLGLIRKLWALIAHQLPYEHYYHLDVLGRVLITLDSERNRRTRPLHLVAYGVRMNVFESEDDIETLAMQKAMMMSKKILPF